ncbi:MAG: hypothetical protein HOP36_08190 [Methyloglobulus sp.]|nr:hypothetical protein [Methyloglobulus sp.]
MLLIDVIEPCRLAAWQGSLVRVGITILAGVVAALGHYHEPESCTCEQCGKALVMIGEYITEQLE